MSSTDNASINTSPAVGSLDVEKVRADFPILAREVNGKPLVYLDNGASTQKPRQVIDRLTKYYEEENANIHRGVHFLSQEATRLYEDARSRVQRFLGASRPEEIVFTRGTTEAINLVAQSFVKPRLNEGDEIIVSGMEHHSNIVPWQLIGKERGAKLLHVQVNERGEVDLDHYASLLSDKTRFVGIVHVSNALGTINPVQEMIALAKERGIATLVDGAQAVAHEPVDVQALDCDFYAFSGHKIYGPTGIGALYGKFEQLEATEPYQGGGEMILSVSFDETVFNKVPAKFEAGTPNIAGTIGLGAALDYVESLGLERIRDHEAGVLAYGTERLQSLPGLRLIGTAEKKASILSFVIDGVHPHDIGTILDQEGIAIRAGHHCAQPVIERFGVPATIRASLGVYSTRDDIDVLVDSLGKVREIFG
ncbi:MAG: cysteine desulfurase [Planctomycetota bacterium]